MINFPSLQEEFLQALRLGSGREADKIVQQILDENIEAHSIYMDLFQPVAYKIGELWQRNEFSVAQEHLATAIIEREIGELHPFFKPDVRKNRTILIGSVENELHRIGGRMVADFLEADGWNVHYLGAAVPTESFISMAREMNADMIGASAQMVYHIDAIIQLAQEADRQGLAGIPIITGGLPFIDQPDLYQSLGVLNAGKDAHEAVSIANQIFENIQTA